MNDFTLWFWVFVVLLIAGLFAIGFLGHRQRERDLAQFAHEWKGRVVARGFFQSSAVKLYLEDQVATVEFTEGGDDEPSQTHMVISLPGSRLRMELKPQTAMRALGRYLGMQDIEVGSRDFDESFVIQGSEPARIQEFLTRDVQKAILELAYNPGQYVDLHVILSGGVLRITKHQRLATVSQLSRFASCCRNLLKVMQQAQTAGIEFVGQSPPQLVQDTQCQVCGDPLAGHVVFCAKCKTPHHLDCWEYFGSCAIYGCGQRKFLPAKRA